MSRKKQKKETPAPRTRIQSIEIRDGDVTFYFEDTKRPFNAREFNRGSTTWEDLKNIEDAILWFNSIADAAQGRAVTLRD